MSTQDHDAKPLLPKKLLNEQAEPLTKASSSAIKALSILRFALGTTAAIAPRFTCGLFMLPVPAGVSVMTRLVGAGDLVLGELLITAEDKNSADGGRREIKRALWAGIGADCVSLASFAFELASGTVGRAPALLFAGGAAATIGLSALGMRGL
jgi:hypothetical protein